MKIYARLDDAVAAAFAIESDADALFDQPELLEQGLTVCHQSRHLVERFGGEDERRLRHPFDRLASRIVGPRDQMVMHRAGSRDDLRRRYARHRNSVVVNFFRESLREALECRLLGAVAYAAAKNRFGL